jgi:hypothetical protein
MHSEQKLKLALHNNLNDSNLQRNISYQKHLEDENPDVVALK